MAIIRTIEIEQEGDSLTLSQLVEAVKSEEEILVTSGGITVARVLHAETPQDRLQFGSAKGLAFWMADDFDEELKDFDEP